MKKKTGVAAQGWWLSAFDWGVAEDHFTTALLPGLRVFSSADEARAAWPRARRHAWGKTPRFTLPDAAHVFDGLSRAGWRYIWDHAGLTEFSPVTALAAIDADRQAVTAFEHRDPSGAASMADYLELWHADLTTLERLALDVANGARGESVYGAMCSAQTYGDG